MDKVASICIIKKYFGVNNSQEIGQSVLSEYVSVTNGVLLSRKLWLTEQLISIFIFYSLNLASQGFKI